jgi:hypothetical protein
VDRQPNQRCMLMPLLSVCLTVAVTVALGPEEGQVLYWRAGYLWLRDFWDQQVNRNVYASVIIRASLFPFHFVPFPVSFSVALSSFASTTQTKSSSSSSTCTCLSLNKKNICARVIQTSYAVHWYQVSSAFFLGRTLILSLLEWCKRAYWFKPLFSPVWTFIWITL